MASNSVTGNKNEITSRRVSSERNGARKTDEIKKPNSLGK